MNDQEIKKQDRLSFIFTAAAVALVVFMMIFIPINPLRKYKRSVMEVENMQSEIAGLVQVRNAHIERLRNQEIIMRNLSERRANFDLWSFINSVLTEESLKERANLRNVAPKLDKTGATSNLVTMVELGLAPVSLKELANVLHKVYSSNNLIVVYRMWMHPANDKKGLECDITFLSPKPAAPGTAMSAAVSEAVPEA